MSDDPNEAYTVEPNTGDTMLRDWYVVKAHGVPVRIMPKELAERYATDPEYRVQVRRGETKHHEREAK